jgi:hypothetical protein
MDFWKFRLKAQLEFEGKSITQHNMEFRSLMGNPPYSLVV